MESFAVYENEAQGDFVNKGESVELSQTYDRSHNVP